MEWNDEVFANVFGGPDQEEHAEAMADEWRQWLREHGYREADVDIPAIWADIRLVSAASASSTRRETCR